MNIYSICMAFEMEDGCDVGYAWEYLTHKNKYTKEEFIALCEDCLSKCKDKCNWEMKRRLKSDYGFEDLVVLGNFDFTEDCE